MWYHTYVTWILGFHSSLILFFIFLSNYPRMGEGVYGSSVFITQMLLSYMTSVLASDLTAFSTTFVLRTLVCPWGWFPLPYLATDFLFSFLLYQLRYHVWQFIDFLVLTWLVCMGVMGKWDRMCWVPYRVPVGTAALANGIRTFQPTVLLTHSTSWALHISLIFCLPHVSYTPFTISRIIVCWTLLECYKLSFMCTDIFWFIPLCAYVYTVDVEWADYFKDPSILYLCIAFSCIIST